LKSATIFFVVFIVSALASISALQPATGVNEFRQVFEINGTFTAGTDIFNVTLPSSLKNLDKSIAFLTFEYNGQNQHRDTFRSYNFTDEDTLTIYGNDDTPSANFNVGFHGTIFEFTQASDVFVQHLEFTMTALLPEGEFEISIPLAINTSSSFILPTGSHHDSIETTVGVEEFTKFRIINSTFYGLEVGDTPNTGDTVYHQSIIDLNVPTVAVQRGQGSLLSGETIDTITPSAYNKTNSILFVSFNTNGDFSQEPREVAISATINGADDIIIERNTADATNTVDYSFELIEFDDGFIIAQHFIGSQAGGTSVSLETIPTPVGDLTRSWAIGTVVSPFGLGNGRSDSEDNGAFDKTTATITLNSTSEVELVRGDGGDTYDVGLQVIEFLIQDIASVTNQTISDVVFAIDQGTQFNITKVFSDTATVNDAVILERIVNQNETDTVTVTDQTNFNITKSLLDLTTVTDQTNFNITKLLNDTATVNDAVITNRVLNQTETDTATVTDQTNFNVTKSLLDVTIVIDQVQTNVTTITDLLLNDTATVTDQTNLNVTKSLLDTTLILDGVINNVTTINDVLLNDTSTVLDLVSLLVDKSEVDVVTTVDQGTEFNVTKVFADVVIVQDNVINQVFTVFNTTNTDTASILDQIELEITRAIQDNVIVLDGVDTSTLTQIIINDIVTVSDPNLAIIITPVLPPTGGGGSGSSGGGTPDPEGFQRIIGLDIQSEVIEIQTSSVVPSDFEITVFGQQTADIFITGLVTEPQFVTWFNFGEEPRQLDFDVTIDQEKTSNDPTRIQNLALDDFVVTAPNIPCSILDPFDPPQACLDPILYEVPVEFEFSKGGTVFHEDHIIIVDARVLEESCVVFGLEYPLIFCENVSLTTFSVVDGGTENSIPILILPILVLALFTFVVFAFRQGRVGRATTRRKFRKRDELTSMSDRQVRRKFKRGR